MNGVLPFLKPPAMTSQQAVTHVKRVLGAAKAGHAGTLDPGAAGVLPVLVGRATKLSDLLMDRPKEYIAELTVGVSTDTLDADGMPTAVSSVRFDRSALESVLPEFRGHIEQVPPMYSAVKCAGRPLYRYARQGNEVERRPRCVDVRELTILDAGADSFLLRIACSKGTYVRTLLHDIAVRLGAEGHTSFLLRSASGGFRIDEAYTLDELERARQAGSLSACLTDPAQAAAHLPQLCLPPHLYPILDSGAAIDLARTALPMQPPAPAYAVFCRGEFFGIGTIGASFLRLQTRIKP